MIPNPLSLLICVSISFHSLIHSNLLCFGLSRLSVCWSLLDSRWLSFFCSVFCLLCAFLCFTIRLFVSIASCSFLLYTDRLYILSLSCLLLWCCGVVMQ